MFQFLQGRWAVQGKWLWRGALLLLTGLASGGLKPLTAATIYVQPIDLCNLAKTTCGDPTLQLYADVANKIWSQAGITVSFLGWDTFTTSDAGLLNVVDDSAFYTLDDYDTARFGSVTVSMWFVPSILWCGGASGGTVYGCSEVNGNTAVISGLVFDVNRLDTMAHELGHTLGLDHCDVEPAGFCNSPLADDLMTSGSRRAIPDSLANVTPDGQKLDQLSAQEIMIADESYHVAPEPATFAMAVAGAGLLFWRRRFRIRNFVRGVD
jgi:hypothetical protein